MMQIMDKLYLFYVESNFHLLLSISYIVYKDIEIDNILFVTHRGVKLPDELSDRLLYDGSKSKFIARIKLYLENKKKYQAILRNRLVVSFSPFQYRFPFRRYFSNYSFIEEGFSAYASHIDSASWKAIVYEYCKSLFIDILLPFAGRNIKGFLMGITPSLLFTNRISDIIVCSEQAYSQNRYSSVLNKIVVPIYSPREKSSRVNDRIILIMDRQNPHGRPFDDNIYRDVLYKTLVKMNLTQYKLLVKMHPSDYMYPEYINKTKDYLNNKGLDVFFINNNVEALAQDDAGNTFIGTNSTILYYAPILGKSNHSISFARLLAKTDQQYDVFLKGWGGVDEFCRIFSRQVKCL